MGVKVDYRELKEFSEKLKSLNQTQKEKFLQMATKQMAARLLALVIPRTPVKTGVLRRGWTGGMDAGSAASRMSVERIGKGSYSITITNPIEYASYVEYGHRQTPGRYVPAIGKRLKASWVNGQFFLRASEEGLRTAAPAILTPLLEAFLRQVF